MKTIRYALGDDRVARVVLDAPGAPVNTMTAEWQADMAALADRLEADRERLKGVTIESAKQTFFAGAALRHLLTLTDADAPRLFREVEAMKRSFRRIESLGRPVVALLSGAALGGGWELALVAHARFAIDDESIRFGTPEVSLGLIPGATGITKTVRRLGLVKAAPYLVEGKLFGPREAAELGWIDGLGASIDDLRADALAWIDAHPDTRQPWDEKSHKVPGGTPVNRAVAAQIGAAPAMLYAKTRGRYPAAEAILEAMVEGSLVDVDTAYRIESRKLAGLAVGRNAKNMIGAFFFDANAVRGKGKAPPAYVERLQKALADERQAMRDEGVPASVIRRAWVQAGFSETALDDDGDGAIPRADRDDAGGAIEPFVERLLDRGALEAARAVADGTVGSPAEANIGAIRGAGWPAWTGGPLRWIANAGDARFLDRAAGAALPDVVVAVLRTAATDAPPG